MVSENQSEETLSRRSLTRAGFWSLVHVIFFSLSHPALVWLLGRWLGDAELSAFAVSWALLVLCVQIQAGLTHPLPAWRDKLPPVLSGNIIRSQLRHHVALAAAMTIVIVILILAVSMVLPDDAALKATSFSVLGFALFWPTISLIILPRRLALYIGRVDLSARLSFTYFLMSIAMTGLLQALNLLTAISAFLALATAAFLTAWPAIRAEQLQPDTGYALPDSDKMRHSPPDFISITALKRLLPGLTGWCITVAPLIILGLGDDLANTALFFILMGLVAPMQAFLRVTERLHHTVNAGHPLLDSFRQPLVATCAVLGVVAYLIVGLSLSDINDSIFHDRFVNGFDGGLGLYWFLGFSVLLSSLVALLSKGKRFRDPDHGTTGTGSHAMIRIAFILGSIIATLTLGPVGTVAVLTLWQIWRLLRVTLIEWRIQ